MNKRKARSFSLLQLVLSLSFLVLTLVVLLKPYLQIETRLNREKVYKKMCHKSNTNHIHIGKSADSVAGDTQKIQVNDAFIPIKDLNTALDVLERRGKNKPLNPEMSIEEGAAQKAVEQVRRKLQLSSE